MSKAVAGMSSVLVFESDDTQVETEEKWRKWWGANQRIDQTIPSLEAHAELLEESEGWRPRR